MKQAIGITGAYEAELSQAIVILTASAPGSELRVTTPPGMGVVTYTRSILESWSGRYVEIACGSIDQHDLIPLPVPDGNGGVDWIHPIFKDPSAFKLGDLIVVQDLSEQKWQALTHVREWVEEQQNLGSRVILIFSNFG